MRLRILIAGLIYFMFLPLLSQVENIDLEMVYKIKQMGLKKGNIASAKK